MFVVSPRITREINKTFKFTPLEPGEQYDYSVSRATVEIPYGRAHHIEDKRRTTSSVKPGDIVVIEASVEVTLTNRIILVDVPAALYKCGRPTFKHTYKHGDKAFAPVHFECYSAIDLKSLPYLFEIYIYDLHLR